MQVSSYWVLDFDHCVVDGEIDSAVLDVIRELNTYAEISPSDNGIHVFFYGKLPPAGQSKKVLAEVTNGS